jgi:hypothetical protein
LHATTNHQYRNLDMPKREATSPGYLIEINAIAVIPSK